MSLYKEHERISVNFSGYKKIQTDHVVKFVSDDKYGSFISYFDFAGSDPTEIIREEISFFRKLGKGFEWKTYSSDKPVNIGELLIQQGFEMGEAESFMALELSKFQEVPTGWKCSRITTADGIEDVVSVSEQVWGEDQSHHKKHLVDQLESNPESLSIYCVYIDGKPVSSARIEFSKNSPFAGIWGGATLKQYRKQGIYQALLNVRVREAIERGYQYLIIDASDMSKPIVLKHGFEFICSTVPYEYKPTDV